MDTKPHTCLGKDFEGSFAEAGGRQAFVSAACSTMKSFRLSSVCRRAPRHMPASLLLVEIFLHCLLLTVAICPSVCLHPFIVYSSIFRVYCASGLLTPLAKHGTEKEPIGFQSQRNWVLIPAPCLGFSLLSLHLVMSETGTVVPALLCGTGNSLQHKMPSGLQGAAHGILSHPSCLPSSDSAPGIPFCPQLLLHP